MKTMMRMVLDIVASAVASVLGFLPVAAGHDLLTQVGVEVPLFGDKGNILWGLLIGLPIGAAVGLWGVERLVYRVRPPIVKTLLAGWLPAVALMFVALFLVDRFGTVVLLAYPVIVGVCLTVTLRILTRRPAVGGSVVGAS